MENFTTKELNTKQQIEQLEKIIGNRATEFIGEVGDFQWFL